MPKRTYQKDYDRLCNVGEAEEYLLNREIKVIDSHKGLSGKKLVDVCKNDLLGEGDLITMSGGMPARREKTELEEETLIITPETDIRNEVVLRYIEEWQQKAIRGENRLPQPGKVKGSKKLDWGPVWAWAKIHPQVSIKEIAKMLNRNYTQVKSKLEEVDKMLLISFQK